MVNLSQSTKFFCAQSLLALLIVAHTAIAGESPTAASCCQQSGTTQSSLAELPAEAIQKLKIDAGFGWGIFSGTIFNGNDNFHITQLVVSMTPVRDGHHMHMHADMSHDPKIHHIDLELPPASKGALSMPLTGDDVHIHDFKWEVIKVIGYQTN
jgi:hypothetical protein